MIEYIKLNNQIYQRAGLKFSLSSYKTTLKNIRIICNDKLCNNVPNNQNKIEKWSDYEMNATVHGSTLEFILSLVPTFYASRTV